MSLKIKSNYNKHNGPVSHWGWSVSALLCYVAALPTCFAAQKVSAPKIDPILPPAHICTQKEIQGLWQWTQLLDTTDSHAAIKDFAANPDQYIIFRENHTYGQIKTNKAIAADTLHSAIDAQNNGLQQYVTDKSGYVFFYQDGKVSDAEACFIVTGNMGVFHVGQMLLMVPPAIKNDPNRVIKIYSRI